MNSTTDEVSGERTAEPSWSRVVRRKGRSFIAGLFEAEKVLSQNYTVGDRASIIISADLVQLTPEPTHTRNEIECRFISEEFVGSVVTLLTESFDGSDFKIQIQQRELSELDFSPGSVLYAHWDTRDAHILIDVS